MERLFIDTETTGLYPKFNKTLTVGMVLADVEKDFLKTLKQNHIFIKHDNYNVSSMALKINGIDLDEHHKIGLYPDKACNKINDFIEKNGLNKTILVGHNIGFDKGFLNSLFLQGEIEPKFHNEEEDTYWIWKNLQRNGKIPRELRGKLGVLAEYFGINYSKAHDALADCHITSQVYHKMLGV